MFHGNPIVTLVGGLVREPEVKFTNAGHALANFTLVTKDRRKDASGSWNDHDVTYWDVVAWRQVAENLADAGLKPGDQLLVAGVVKQESWQNPEGEKRSKFKVTADHIGVSLDRVSVTLRRVEREAATLDTQAPPSAAPVTDEPPF